MYATNDMVQGDCAFYQNKMEEDCLVPDYPDYNTEEYEKAEENGFYLTAVQPLSTFSADVDTASYSNIRRMIEDGYTLDEINPDAVRAEEFINYFSYDLKLPKKGDMFGVTTEISTCPWNEKHELMMVGMRTEEIDMSKAPDNNLVFLLDVSGSMSDNDKLPLLQKSFTELVSELGENDTVSIVTYASGVNTVLDGVSGSQKDKICQAIDSLYASGGTNGEGGIQRAYQLAESNFIRGGNNRVILATDGDLNIGISEPDELEKLIEQKRESGVYLSVLGFGTGNIKDNNMERLADCGNGNYAYIDSLFEAKKVLVEEMGATLLTIAEDVKLQVEFNPATVNAYRLIGYENRMLDATDFQDDTKDAGEIGAGHTVVALYEIIPVGSQDEIALKYQNGNGNKQKTGDSYADEYATVSIRYKEPGKSKSDLVSYVVSQKNFSRNPSDDFVFASLAAEFAMILSDSPNKGDATLEGIMKTYATLDMDDEYKDEFYYLVKMMAKRQ
jgi:Ca-activated chloride channel family protein